MVEISTEIEAETVREEQNKRESGKTMRKAACNSTMAAVAAAQAPESINPPAHVLLRDGDRPFWDSIVRARASATWNASDLEHAANLARCKADIERLQSEITAQGDIIENDRGTQVINPRHSLLEVLSRRSVSLSRMLHIHAEATCGESREQAKRAQPEIDAKAAARSALIPRLTSVG